MPASSLPGIEACTLAILAGGEGRRMGTPKGLLSLDGRPILERIADALSWPGPRLLVTAPGRQHPPGCQRFSREVIDPVAGQGPLRGLLTALEHSTTPELVIIPLDMPEITAGPLQWLLDQLRARPGCTVAMIARRQGAQRWIEPFPAVIRRRIEPAIRRLLESGERAMHRLAQIDGAMVLDCPPDWPAAVWTNLNRREDVDGYLAGGRPSPNGGRSEDFAPPNTRGTS